jgi:hypothetical protein
MSVGREGERKKSEKPARGKYEAMYDVSPGRSGGEGRDSGQQAGTSIHSPSPFCIDCINGQSIGRHRFRFTSLLAAILISCAKVK